VVPEGTRTGGAASVWPLVMEGGAAGPISYSSRAPT
jgi:hypothetical protein